MMPFCCPDCDAVSHHPEDERHGYCARCQEFKPKRKIATTVYLPEYQLKRLRLLKAATGLSAAELVRRGVDLMLEREHLVSVTGVAHYVLREGYRAGTMACGPERADLPSGDGALEPNEWLRLYLVPESRRGLELCPTCVRLHERSVR